MAKSIASSRLWTAVLGVVCLMIAVGWFRGTSIHQSLLADHKQERLQRSVLLDSLRSRYPQHDWIGEYRVQGLQEYAFALGLTMGASISQAKQWLGVLSTSPLYGYWNGATLWKAGSEKRLSAAALQADSNRQPLIFVLPASTTPPEGLLWCNKVDLGDGYGVWIERSGSC